MAVACSWTAAGLSSIILVGAWLSLTIPGQKLQASNVPLHGASHRSAGLRHAWKTRSPLLQRWRAGGFMQTTRDGFRNMCPRAVQPGAETSSALKSNKTLDLGREFSPNSIRHPLDKQYTRALQSLPGIDAIIRSMAGSVAEQVLGLDNVGRGVLVGPTQAPRIYRLLEEACEILQMKPPALYIRQNPTPNAYTLAISGKQPFIVIHTAIIDLMTDQELQAVLAHELGHLKCDHGVWLTIANMFSLGFSRLIPIPIIADTLEESIMRWARSAELTCDRAAMLVAQDPKVVLSVLMKLAGGCVSLDGELNVDAFLQQARTYDEAASTPVGWYLRNAEARQLTHPLPVMRAREIDQWSRSPEYRRLIRDGPWQSI